MFYASLIFALLFAVACGYNTGLKMSTSISKYEAFESFRPHDPLRHSLNYLSKAAVAAFQPFNAVNQYELNKTFPKLKKSMSVVDLRRLHKRSQWDNEDLACEFAATFGVFYPKPSYPTDQSDAAQEQMLMKDEVTDFLAQGVVQAFSPTNQFDSSRMSKTLAPFHKEVHLSDLKRVLRRDPKFFMA